MTGVSAINPLRTAVGPVLKALPIVGGPSAGRVFHTVAPRGTALPFIVIDGETENEEGARYGQAGQTQSTQIRSWGTDSYEAQDVYNAVKGALHGVNLTVSGFQYTRGTMERLTGFKDEGVPPDEAGPYCVVGEYNSETRV